MSRSNHRSLCIALLATVVSIMATTSAQENADFCAIEPCIKSDLGFKGRFSGRATFYDHIPPIRGACGSEFTYPGFTTVALNRPMFGGPETTVRGAQCGACLKACYDVSSYQFTDRNNVTHPPRFRYRRCFKAVVDDECPMCPNGHLDIGELGVNQEADGTWPLFWKWIRCPQHKKIVRSVDGNPWFGKIKVEGGGKVVRMVCDNGADWNRTNDGFWKYNWSPALSEPTLNCQNLRCEAHFERQRRRTFRFRIKANAFAPNDERQASLAKCGAT